MAYVSACPKEFFRSGGGARGDPCSRSRHRRIPGAGLRSDRSELAEHASLVPCITCWRRLKHRQSGDDSTAHAMAKSHAELWRSADMYEKTRAEGFGVKSTADYDRHLCLSHGYYDAYYIRRSEAAAADCARLHCRVSKVRCDHGPHESEHRFQLGEKAADPLQMYLSELYDSSDIWPACRACRSRAASMRRACRWGCRSSATTSAKR